MTSDFSDWFSRYEFRQPIAQGGMGVVYLAKDKGKDNALCVIKQLRSDSEDTEELTEARRLFKREVDILKELDHPGIVEFFDDHSTDDGKYFLVMDYIQGHNLETILQNHGPFSQDDAIKVAIQICEVLEYLHEQHPPIIYRDLKPSNLMLTPEGQIIFIDFGIARQIFISKDSATRVVTAGYSPPEQYFGKPETRSDLYALGATMSHLLTGARPRPLLTSVPSQHVHDLLTSLDDLVKDLTAHTPDDRPESARSVRLRLYRIYQELNPNFEIPEEALAGTGNGDEQFISQKIMRSGLKAASSASDELPTARGAENEMFTEEDMPTGVRRIFEDMRQKLSSGRYPAYNPEEEENGETPASADRNRRPRKTLDRYKREPSFWDKMIGWFKRG